MHLPSSRLKVVYLASMLSCLPILPHFAEIGGAGPVLGFGQALAQDAARGAPSIQKPMSLRAPRSERPKGASQESAILLACDEKHEATEFTLPGAKGAMKIDKCYRGREHFVCRISTLNAGSKALVEDYKAVTETKYPDFANLESICALSRAKISGDLDTIAQFPPRFNALKSGYESQVACASSLERSIKEANLGDLPQAKGVVASLEDAVQFDLKDLPDSRKTLFDLAVSIESSEKALAVIEKLHLAMCRPN